MDLASLKINIKSILTSTQKPLTPRDLQRDFQELEGYDIPYRKLGFSDLLQCLQSPEMSDAVKIKYEGATPIVVPVLSEKSAHIDSLVMKQKPKTTRHRPARRSSGRQGGGSRLRPPRFDPKPYRSSTSYNSSWQQSSSYNRQSASSTHAYIRTFGSTSSYPRTSNSTSTSAYPRTSTSAYPSTSTSAYPRTSSNPSYQPAGSEVPSYAYSKPKPAVTQSSVNSQNSVPTFLREKVVEFLKSKPQGASDRDVCIDLLSRSFTDYGIKTAQGFLERFSDVVVRRDNRYYLKIAQQYSSQPTAVPASYEDEAYEEDYDSEEDYDNDITVTAVLPNGAIGHNEERNEKSRLNSKSQNSVCSCESDSGCFDAANERMGNRMRHNIQLLLDKHPKGISLIDFGNLYKEQFGYPLNFEDLQFPSMIDFVVNHPSIFFCYRLDQSDDFIIFDAKKEIPAEYKMQSENKGRNKKIPPDIHENMKQLLLSKKVSGLSSTETEKLYLQKYNRELNLEELGFDCVEALFVALAEICYLRPVGKKLRAYPKFSIESGSDSPDPDQFHIPVILQSLFPSECCDSNSKIPLQRIENEDTSHSDDGSKLYIEICLSEVYSPVNFFFHLRSKKAELDEMMNDLEEFYNIEEKAYRMPPTIVTIGQICCAKYSVDGKWHRVRVMSIPNLREVTVFFVDYGTIGKVQKSDLRFLHKDFESMPRQAIRGKCHNLKPVEGKKFDVAANRLFFSLTDDVDLMAEIVNIKTKDEDLELELNLYDTTGEEDVIIEQVLIEKGYATYKVPPEPEEPEIFDIASGVNNLSLHNGVQDVPSNSSFDTIADHHSSMTESQPIDPSSSFQSTDWKHHQYLSSEDFANEASCITIAQSWASKNSEQQTPNPFDTYLDTGSQDSTEKQKLKELKKELSRKFIDSFIKTVKSTVDMSSNSSNASSQDQVVSRSSVPFAQPFSAPDYTNTSLNPPVSNNQYLQQPSYNFNQSMYLPNSFQQNPFQPPGLPNPSLPNQYTHLLNRPYATQVPIPQYPYNPPLHQYPMTQHFPNAYPNFQVPVNSQQSYLNSTVPNQTFVNPYSNVGMSNIPYNPNSNLTQNFQNQFSTVTQSNPLINTQNLGYNYPQPLQTPTPSAFVTVQTSPVEPATLNQNSSTPANSYSVGSEQEVSYSPKKSPALDGTSSAIDIAPSKVNSSLPERPTSTARTGSPPSQEVEEIMKTSTKELCQKLAEELLKKISVNASKSSQPSEPADKTVGEKQVSQLAETVPVKAPSTAENSVKSKNDTQPKSKSPFENFCEQMKVASSPTDNSNLLHKIFPQLESKLRSKMAEKASQASIAKSKTDSDVSTKYVENFQSDHISSTTSDSENQKKTVRATNERLLNTVADKVENSDDSSPNEPAKNKISFKLDRKIWNSASIPNPLVSDKASSLSSEPAESCDNKKQEDSKQSKNICPAATGKLPEVSPIKTDRLFRVGSSVSPKRASPISGSNVIKEIVVKGKALHLLMIGEPPHVVPHIITDEFAPLFTSFTKRQSMEKVLQLRFISLPFLDYHIQSLSSNLPPDAKSVIEKYEKFEKIHVLPLKDVPKLLEALSIDESITEAFQAYQKRFELS